MIFPIFLWAFLWLCMTLSEPKRPSFRRLTSPELWRHRPAVAAVAAVVASSSLVRGLSVSIRSHGFYRGFYQGFYNGLFGHLFNQWEGFLCSINEKGFLCYCFSSKPESNDWEIDGFVWKSTRQSLNTIHYRLPFIPSSLQYWWGLCPKILLPSIHRLLITFPVTRDFLAGIPNFKTRSWFIYTENPPHKKTETVPWLQLWLFCCG